MKTPQQTLVKTNTPCLYRSEQTGIYYALLKIDKKQVKRSLHTTDKAQARADLETLRQELREVKTDCHAQPAPPPDCDLAAMADDWLSSQTGLKTNSRLRLEVSLRSVKAGFPCSVRSVTTDGVRAWLKRRESEVAPRTANKELVALRSVLSYAVEKGFADDNAAASIGILKTSKPIVRIPSKAEFAAVLAELEKEPQSKQALRLVKFLAYSGCRLGEALGVVWGDIDFEAGTFKVTGGEEGTKNRRERVVPIFAPLRDLLESMRPETPDLKAALFTVKSSRNAIASACRKAKVEPFGHHAMRHLFVSTCVEQGIDFRTIAGWVGHSDGGVLLLKTYAHLRDEHSQQMAQRLTASAYTVTEKVTTSAEPTSASAVASVGGSVTVTGFASGASFTFA